MPISIIICSKAMVCATAMLNANSVPADAQAEIHASARRLAIFLDHIRALPTDIERSRMAFYAHLNRNWMSYKAGARTRMDLEYVAYADGLEYMGRLHAIFYEFKAFLDILTRLICRLVASKSPPDGFNKGKVDGSLVSGGRLINWIKGHSVESLPTRDEITHKLVTATKQWITPAVSLRDALGHRRDIAGFQHMRISVTRGPAILNSNDIQLPAMSDGICIHVFVVKLRDELCAFVSDLLPLIPRVNPELNELWRTARSRLQI